MRAKIKCSIWDSWNAFSPITRRDAGMKIKWMDLLGSSPKINRTLECRDGMTHLRWGADESMLPSSKQVDGVGVGFGRTSLSNLGKSSEMSVVFV